MVVSFTCIHVLSFDPSQKLLLITKFSSFRFNSSPWFYEIAILMFGNSKFLTSLGAFVDFYFLFTTEYACQQKECLLMVLELLGLLPLFIIFFFLPFPSFLQSIYMVNEMLATAAMIPSLTDIDRFQCFWYTLTDFSHTLCRSFWFGKSKITDFMQSGKLFSKCCTLDIAQWCEISMFHIRDMQNTLFTFMLVL